MNSPFSNWSSFPKQTKKLPVDPCWKLALSGIVSSSGATVYVDPVALSTLSPPTGVGNSSFLEPYDVHAVAMKLRWCSCPGWKPCALRDTGGDVGHLNRMAPVEWLILLGSAMALSVAPGLKGPWSLTGNACFDSNLKYIKLRNFEQNLSLKCFENHREQNAIACTFLFWG